MRGDDGLRCARPQSACLPIAVRTYGREDLSGSSRLERYCKNTRHLPARSPRRWAGFVDNDCHPSLLQRAAFAEEEPLPIDQTSSSSSSSAVHGIWSFWSWPSRVRPQNSAVQGPAEHRNPAAARSDQKVFVCTSNRNSLQTSSCMVV
jgi:hypothetical protein